MEAVVILPDYLHCIWTLPEGNDNFPTCWRQIKAAFSRQLPKAERRSKSQVQKVDEASGNDGFGNMRYGMARITDMTRLLRSKLMVLYHKRAAIDLSERVCVLRGSHLARYRHRAHLFLRDDNAF